MQRCKRDQLAHIRKTLQKLKTLPQLIDHFINSLQHIDKHGAPDTSNSSTYTPQLLAAHASQNNIGYQAFLKGFMSKEWCKIQDQYYRHQRFGNQYNMHRWRKETVKLLVNYGNELWNERCTIVNSEKIANDEQLYRTKMY